METREPYVTEKTAPSRRGRPNRHNLVATVATKLTPEEAADLSAWAAQEGISVAEALRRIIRLFAVRPFHIKTEAIHVPQD
jgi:hypothetical protein